MGVVGNLLSGQKAAYVENIRAEYLDVANKHARAEADKKRLPLAQARQSGRLAAWAFDKTFHVSPFMGMQRAYDWRFSLPDEQLLVQMLPMLILPNMPSPGLI